MPFVGKDFGVYAIRGQITGKYKINPCERNVSRVQLLDVRVEIDVG